LAAGQAQLFHGVHLPDVMGLLRGLSLPRGLAARRRGRLPGPPPPALQRAHARHRQAGVQLGQADPDEAGPPGRMGLPQEQGLLDQGIVGQRGEVRRPVPGRASFAALAAEPLDQVLYGSQRQVQAPRDGSPIEPALMQGGDQLTDRQGDRSWHS
jgi:hypothetical protein